MGYNNHHPQPAANALANVAHYVVSHHLRQGALLAHVQLGVYEGPPSPFLQSCSPGSQCPAGGTMQNCLPFHC